MKVIGLTGGIGMGKSACADLMRARGVPVIDTDDLARRVVEPGQPALEEIRKRFGEAMIGPDGALLREKLARKVFSNPTARKDLEGILHPRIRESWRAQIETWRQEGRPLAVVVIPLLFEVSLEHEVDVVLCVGCTPETQRRRLDERGWQPEEIEARIAAQWPAEQKLARADFVIWTEGSLELHAAQLDRVLSTITGAAPGAAGSLE